MENTNAKPLSKVGKFFKALGEGYAKVPFILKIVVGMVIGVLFALLLPKATVVAMFGTVFVGALKAIAPVLVFVLIITFNGRQGHRFTLFQGYYILYNHHYTCRVHFGYRKFYL